MTFSAGLLGMTGAVLVSGGLVAGLLSLMLVLIEVRNEAAVDRLFLLSTRMIGIGAAALIAAVAVWGAGG